MEAKTNNINLIKRIYFSICKINKYGELIKKGLKDSIYYVMDLILICSIIYAGVITFQTRKNIKELRTYLEGNFPNVICKDNKATSETEERVILNDDLIKLNFGGQIVIDTHTEYDSLVDEYKNIKEPTILLTENEYVLIDSTGRTASHNYDEMIKQDEDSNIKDYFLNLCDNTSYVYYFIIYLLGSCIGTSIVIFIYGAIMSALVFIICKIKKKDIKFSEIYCRSLYSQTLLILSYYVINFIPYNVNIYIRAVILLIPLAYLAYSIYINNTDKINK